MAARPPGSTTRQRAQRGAVSVEFALLVPILLMLVVGTVHFGTVIVARHRVTDAVNVATRTAAVRGAVAPGQVRALVLSRLGSTSRCARVAVSSAVIDDVAGVRLLEVGVTCELAPSPGAPLLGTVGPDRFTVTAAMPL